MPLVDITPVYYVSIENARLRLMRSRTREDDLVVAQSSPMPPLADAQRPMQRSGHDRL